jgi:hypothetical protein
MWKNKVPNSVCKNRHNYIWDSSLLFSFKVTSLAATLFLLLSGSCTSSHWRLQMELLFIYMLLYSYSPSVLKHASFEVGFHFRKQKKKKKIGWCEVRWKRWVALHYHVRMSRDVFVKKEPTALLRKPKISRTLSVFEITVLGRKLWPKMEEFREKKCTEKRWMFFAIRDRLLDCHMKEMRRTVHVARISPVHHSESYYTTHITIAVL